MKLYGLLITKDDHQAFGDWCRDQLRFYDAVVCLDGSDGDETALQARQFADRLIYRHEREFAIPARTDHGLRRVVHEEIVRRFGVGHWIMCCHTDEYCYHDPRKIAARAEREGYDLVSWFSPHFYPHPSELPDLEERLRRPVAGRFEHYHWGYAGTDLPWIEDRLYKADPGVAWDDHTHGSVRPHGLRRPAPFYPILRHFKVCSLDLSGFELDGHATRYRGHWRDQEHRTGLPFRVEKQQDFFVRSVPRYAFCSRFDGRFDQPWNMGEEYRPDSEAASRPASFPVKAPHTSSARPVVAFGPEVPGFGSWEWVGADTAQELSSVFDTRIFHDEIPDCEALVLVKFKPPAEVLRSISRRAAVIYCPIDAYGSRAEIEADADALRSCDLVLVHCERLRTHVAPYAAVEYIDHHVKFAGPPRREYRGAGPILWVGVRTNLPPLVAWANRNALPEELWVLTNPEDPDRAPTARDFGFRNPGRVRIERWTAERQRQWTEECRAALDVKGHDFRARHKPPAKAIDFLASGVPLAMNADSSSTEHLARMGFQLASPHEPDRWLSREYWEETVRFGAALRELLPPRRVALRWKRILERVLAGRARENAASRHTDEGSLDEPAIAPGS